jgi:Uma2 family endonuclease
LTAELLQQLFRGFMTTATSTDTKTLLLDVSNTILHVTPEQFDRLCVDNPDLRLELAPDRQLIVMTPAFGESGKQNGNLFARVWNWNDRTKLGDAFDSSTGYDFTAIGGGKPSPDVSWIEKSRLEGVSLQQFIPVVPDFVIELRSTTDRISDVRKKMIEYQRLGVKLGLLINPQAKQVEVYESGLEVKTCQSPTEIDCDSVMPGFELSLSEIW